MKSQGLGIWGVLLVVFVVLKLTENISWGWEWVLAPLWAPLVLEFFGVAFDAGMGR